MVAFALSIDTMDINMECDVVPDVDMYLSRICPCLKMNQWRIIFCNAVLAS
jgi:hypothetical protein